MTELKPQNLRIGNTYSMINRDGSSSGAWKIAYYPLEGTWEGSGVDKTWVDFDERRALIEQPRKGGTDFREVPLRYLEPLTGAELKEGE